MHLSIILKYDNRNKSPVTIQACVENDIKQTLLDMSIYKISEMLIQMSLSHQQCSADTNFLCLGVFVRNFKLRLTVYSSP